MVPALLCGYVRECFSPPASLETQSAQRENMFSFLLRGQKRKDLQHDSGQDNSCAHKNMLLNKMTVPGSACCYLFSFLSKENKSKNKLCELCVSAVSIVLSALNGLIPCKILFNKLDFVFYGLNHHDLIGPDRMGRQGIFPILEVSFKAL